MTSRDSSPNRHDIAVVGMGCRFPGARNVNEYWQLLRDPEPQFEKIPESRWRREAFHNEDFRDRFASYSDRMGVVADVDMFDAAHYAIPPRRARALDPQHRLLVDLTREAIQDAGWEASGFDREDASVIMSLSDSGYREISAIQLRLRQLAGGEFGTPTDEPALMESGSAIGGYHGTALSGVLLNMGPSSISSVFDLHGESYALDAACSGGLAAVSNAVHALREGRCRIAFAGGAQLVLVPDLLIGLAKIGAVSRSGECRPFDRRADGFVLGEGAAVLALRTLADAEAAGDRVYAVIRGVGLSNDGMVKGGMMPQADGQLRALRRAYADAGLPPGAVGLLEAHGTGTDIGDQVEINALRELREGVSAPAYLGAAKAVVGHSLGTAGLAGLVKSVLSVHKGQIPPQPDFTPAGHLGLAEAGLEVPEKLVDWVEPDGRPRRAGVSAFGFGGTNVHVVLEEVDALKGFAEPAEPTPELLVLSARDREGLARHAKELATTLASDELSLDVVAGTLSRRLPFTERLAVVADTVPDAVGKLLMAAMALEGGTHLGPGTFAGTVEPGEETVADLCSFGELPRRERAVKLEELGARAVSGPGLRLVMDKTPQCTLPPSPLSPRSHWVVDIEKRRRARPGKPEVEPAAETVAAETIAAETVAAAPVEDPRPVPVSDPVDLLPIVIEEVSRTSAFPIEDLHARLKLVTDLGFDSLMLTELEVNLRKRAPGAPLEIEHDDTLTIGGLVAVMRPETELPATPAPAFVLKPSMEITWDSSAARMDAFPEVGAMGERLRTLDALGLPNPYYRRHDGNARNTTSVGGRELLSFSSYNYLGLSGHPAVNEAVHAAVERYGTSVSASRLLAGERQLTRDLEKALAELLGTEDCLALVSGHATNVTAIGHVVGPEDLIVHDSLAHDSILQGCALSGATRRPFPHNDYEQLEHILQRTRSRFRRVLVVVEGVYSMDGDLADMPRLIELKKRYGALLLVDEAHSIGTVGRHGGGVGEFFDVDRSDVDLWMGTLSKSLASCGGYLAGSAKLINWLKYTLPGFIYSVGLTPANAAAALSALQVLRGEPGRLDRLRANSALFLDLAKQAGIATGSAGNSPIVPCVIGDSTATLRLATALFDRGVAVDPILHPAVDEKLTRLRFFVTSEHQDHEIRRTVGVLTEELAALAS